jgi:uncharacterized membrane protein YobD (UPF0266 family)
MKNLKKLSAILGTTKLDSITLTSYFCLFLNYSKARIFHKNVAFFHRKAYNEHGQVKDNLRDKLLIEFNKKQKIVIGMSPRQVID